jgi:hypothetical protein
MKFNVCYSLILDTLFNFIITELLFYVLCTIHDVWRLGSISWAVYVFMYFHMVCIQWNDLAKKDPWNKVHMIMIMKDITYKWQNWTFQKETGTVLL